MFSIKMANELLSVKSLKQQISILVLGARFLKTPKTFQPHKAICNNINHSCYKAVILTYLHDTKCLTYSNASRLETSSLSRHSVTSTWKVGAFEKLTPEPSSKCYSTLHVIVLPNASLDNIISKGVVQKGCKRWFLYKIKKCLKTFFL